MRVLIGDPGQISCGFDEKIYRHTTLYVPYGSWSDYAYSDGWYKFINIKEEYTQTSEVKAHEVYALMNAKSMGYMVYDQVNDRVAEVASASNVDEANVNHNWMAFVENGKTYVYSLGAKKYLQSAAGGYTLSSQKASIASVNGNGGIQLGSGNQTLWSFVKNDSMHPDQSVTEVEVVESDGEADAEYYTTDGIPVIRPTKGVYILRSKSGKTRKVVVE